jgi:hypothetical protein
MTKGTEWKSHNKLVALHVTCYNLGINHPLVLLQPVPPHHILTSAYPDLASAYAFLEYQAGHATTSSMMLVAAARTRGVLYAHRGRCTPDDDNEKP